MNRPATVVWLLCLALATGLRIDAQPVTTIYSFINGPATPLAGLTLGNDGNFYGTAKSGGLYNDGTLFKLTTNGVTTTLVNFGTTYSSGANPEANLTLGLDGNFYGTTAGGGTNHSGVNATGTVFRMTTNGTVTVLASFNGLNGGIPRAGLALGPDGNYYGTTDFGGTNGDGAVFKVTTNGSLTTLVNFNGTNGANPLAALTLGPGGQFYGTTEYGGANSDGTVFSVTTNGTFATLFNFAGTNGAQPYGAVTVGSDGNLYGTTSGGSYPNGALDGGTIFKLTTNGVLTTLVQLSGFFGSIYGTSNGVAPFAGLTLGPDGNFYGTTSGGGTNGTGTVIEVTTNGILATLTKAGIPFQTYYNSFGVEFYSTNGGSTIAEVFNGTVTTLYSFSALTNGLNPDGSQPQDTLAFGPDGNLYGTASAGGANGYGAMFKVTTNGAFTTLASFRGNNGGNPMDAVTPGPDGSLYGTANTGGTSGYGTVFKLTTSGAITSLVNFDRANDGANPQAGLIVGPGGNLYGTAAGGGNILLQTGPNSYNAESFGTVFELTTNGSFTPLAYFNGTNGANPYGGLAFGRDGNLYGTTTYGGISNNGVVFQLLTNGTLTALTNFTGANGANPFASLALGPDGNFYGTSEAGGTNNDGTVFQATTNGALTTLVYFTGTNGANPNAGLLPGPDGNFYGTAYFGGAHNNGTVFRVTTGGTLTTLVTFAQTNGAFPVGALALGPDGNFYGTTILGGTGLFNNDGTVFKMTTNGTLTTLYTFAYGNPNGTSPFAGLTLVTNGNFIHFYGTTYSGGIGGGGTVFQLNLTTAEAVTENSTNTFYPLTNELAWTIAGTLSLVSVTATNGTAQLTGSGIVFTPKANFTGTATINYAVTDSAGGTNLSLISVLVTNIPPVANPDVYAVGENSAANLLSPLVNDVPVTSGGFLSLVSVSATNGTAVISGTNVLFTPQANFFGTATVGYTITDNVGGSNSSLITIQVTNVPPVANSQSVTDQENAAQAITLTGFDPNHLPLTFSIISGPVNGALSGLTTNTGVVTYTPGTNFVGTDSFTFLVNNGQTNSAPAIVDLTVTATVVSNTPPVANPDFYTAAENSTNTFSPTANDVLRTSGGVLSIVSVSPTNGTALISGTNVIFTPTLDFIGAATIGYTIADGLGGTGTSLITVTVTNVPPIANPDAYAIKANTTNTFSPLANDVLRTPDGTLGLISVSPTNGTAAISGTNVVFTPALNFLGTTTIGYTITDTVGGTNSSLITVTVTNAITIAITSPVAGQVVSNAAFAVTGTVTASTQPAVTNVFVQLDGGSWTNATTANGWSSWTANVTLTPGSNTFSAYAVDTSGSVSATNLVTFDYGPSADVSLGASAAPEPVGVGSNLVYFLIVSNAGPVTASGVVISNQLPANVTFISATGGASPTNAVLLVNLGSLAVGTNTSVQIVVQPTAAGSLTNTFQVFADQSDPVLTNNSATVVSTVTNAPVVNQAIPGTPIAWTNPRFSPVFTYSLVIGGGPRPIEVGESGGSPATTCQAGDVVLLINTNGNTAPTNWAAVARFFNPADLTGSNGLAATYSQVFFPTNAGISNGFAGFQLLPVVSYLAEGTVTTNGGITNIITHYSEAGPAGGILAGQTDDGVLSVSSQTTAITITAPVAGQQVSNQLFTVTGTSVIGGGVVTVTNVYVQLNNSGWTSATNVILAPAIQVQTANAWANWSVRVSLTPGSNTVQAYAVDTYGNPSATNSVAFDYVTNAPMLADVSLTASVSPNPLTVITSNLLTYTFIVSNAGPATATDVTVSNQIFTQSSPFIFNSATGGSTPTNGILLMNLGSLPPGATNMAQITAYLVRAGNTNVSFYTNDFQAFADQADPEATNNFATVIVEATNVVETLFSKSTLTLTNHLTAITSQQATNYSTQLLGVMPGGTVVYNQTFSAPFSDPTLQAAVTQAATALTNAGASSYLGPVDTSSLQSFQNQSLVMVTNVIGTNITVVQTQYIGPTNIFVGPNQSQPLALLSGQNDDDTLTTFDVTNLVSTTITSNYLYSTVYTLTGVVSQVDVALSLTAAPNPVSVGDPLTYSLTVTNNSSITATGVVVSNTLPASVTVFSLLPGQGSATNQGNEVVYSVGSLPNGDAATLAIVVLPEAAGLLTNIAAVSSAQTDSNPANNVVTNVTAAVNTPITNLVLTLLSSIALNPQTGLFEQSIRVSNGGPATPSSVLVTVAGLPANAQVYNATGKTNGLYYVQSSSPLGVGSNVVFLLEYYVPTRVEPTNLIFTVQAGPVVIPPVVTGTVLNLSGMVKLANGSVLVEFSAVPGQVYAIQYSSDLVTWLTAMPVITAPANQVQWIDSGPPKTTSSPAQAGSRYYRVLLLTPH